MACNGVQPKLKEKPMRKMITIEAVAADVCCDSEYTPVAADNPAKQS
jgi:hypothetical protein